MAPVCTRRPVQSLFSSSCWSLLREQSAGGRPLSQFSGQFSAERGVADVRCCRFCLHINGCHSGTVHFACHHSSHRFLLLILPDRQIRNFILQHISHGKPRISSIRRLFCMFGPVVKKCVSIYFKCAMIASISITFIIAQGEELTE